MAKSACTAGSCACRRGSVYCLPVLAGEALRFAPWRPGEPLVTNRYGIPEPDVDARTGSVATEDGVGRRAAGRLRRPRPAAGHGRRLVRSQLRLPRDVPRRLGWSASAFGASRRWRWRSDWDVPLDAIYTEATLPPLIPDAPRMTARKRYWLMKSEPDAFSIDDLQRWAPSRGRGAQLPGAQLHARRHAGRRRRTVLPLQHQGPRHRRHAAVASAAYPDDTQFTRSPTTTTQRPPANSHAGTW